MEDFFDALDAYIDARIDYRASDPEWRSTRELTRTTDALKAEIERLTGRPE